MAPGLNEFKRMQAGALLPPTFAFRDNLFLVHEMFAHPLGLPVPLNVVQPVIDVNRPRLTVESQSSPVPELERENVWSRADLQHQAVTARAVHSTGWDQEV